MNTASNTLSLYNKFIKKASKYSAVIILIKSYFILSLKEEFFMSEWKKVKKPSRIKKFLHYNNFWVWSVCAIIIFLTIFLISNYVFNYNFVSDRVAEIFLGGKFAIIGFVLTVAAFVFSSKAGTGLIKNKPHGAVFFKVLVFIVFYSIISILSYLFAQFSLLVYIFTIAALTNTVVALYYLYFSLKNFSENAD